LKWCGWLRVDCEILKSHTLAEQFDYRHRWPGRVRKEYRGSSRCPTFGVHVYRLRCDVPRRGSLRLGIPLDDLHRLEQLAREARIELPNDRVVLNGEDVTAEVREPRVSEAASQVAACPGVRRAMRDEQRRIGSEGPAVMEGRDIGTVVFPDARVKIFLDAQPEKRAERRAAELGTTVDDVARELAARDARDRSRMEAPLTQAPDAEYLDTTHLTLDQAEEAVLKLVRARTSNGKDHKVQA
jgi:CMP/dCMP kinase